MFSNNIHTEYNHYTQQQRNKIEETLCEHGNSWSGIIITKYANVPVSIVYTWKRELFQKGYFKYCANRNAYRKILIPNLDHEIASIISKKDNKVNEKVILDELRMIQMFPICFSTLSCIYQHYSHPFTRGDITDENGINYTIKRLTNCPPAANTDANKQLK